VAQLARVPERVRAAPVPIAASHGCRIGVSITVAQIAYCIGTGRNKSGLKNRLAMAAKMIGVKPITAA